MEERIRAGEPLEDNFFLDGREALLFPAEDGGYDYFSGVVPSGDSGHSVLWTKREYGGDAELSFDYIKLDDKDERSVTACILYFMAEGEGRAPYTRDIREWNELRTVPAMNLYFGHMRLYHISFAAYDRRKKPHAYVRGRIYQCGALEGTELKPDYRAGDFFWRGIEHHITAGVRGNELYFRASGEGRTLNASWQIPAGMERTHGRIGFRQMAGRGCYIRNVSLKTER